MTKLVLKAAVFSCAGALSLTASANGATLIIDDATPGQVDVTWQGFDIVTFDGVGSPGDGSDTGAGKTGHQFVGTWSTPDGSAEQAGIIYFVDPGQTDLIRATVEIDWTLVPGPGQETITVTINSTELGDNLGLLPGAFAGLGVPIAQMSGNVTGLFRDATTASPVSPPSNLGMAFNTKPIPQCDDPPVFFQTPDPAQYSAAADTDPAGFVGETAERVAVTQDVSVRSMRWWGIYSSPGTVQADADDFTLNIYADEAGSPSEFPAFSMPLSPVRAGTGQTDPSLRSIFVYAVDLPAALSLQANTTYWFSIVNNTTNDPDDNWSWQFSSDGDEVRKTRSPPSSGAWFTSDRDVSLELCGVVTSNPDCPTDLDLNGLVAGADLAALLAAWGPCDTTPVSRMPDTSLTSGASDVDANFDRAEGVESASDLTFLALRWWGTYFNAETIQADTDDFTLHLYLEQDGTQSMSPFAIIPLNAVRTESGLTNATDALIYEYTASLPVAMTLQANVKHYISIVNDTTNDPDDDWLWQLSSDENGFHKYRTPSGTGTWQTVSTDLAFELITPSCPSDFDDSGTVDGADLAALLAAWGPCPVR